MKKPPMWKMKTGQLIAIADMADSHLQNTIALIERNYRKFCFAAAASARSYAWHPMTPEGASDCAEGEADQLEECAETLEHIEEWCPRYRNLVAEQKRRTKTIKATVICHPPTQQPEYSHLIIPTGTP